jgi:hypothetical protein
MIPTRPGNPNPVSPNPIGNGLMAPTSGTPFVPPFVPSQRPQVPPGIHPGWAGYFQWLQRMKTPPQFGSPWQGTSGGLMTGTQPGIFPQNG